MSPDSPEGRAENPTPDDELSKHAPSTPIPPHQLDPRFYYAALLLVILLVAGIRFHLRTMPLERDEGEYAYAGQLILQGIPPYALAYNVKLPGTYAAYAAIMAVFGQTATGIRLGLLLIDAATIVLVFVLAQRLAGPLAGFVAGTTYAALSNLPSVLGFMRPRHAFRRAVRGRRNSHLATRSQRRSWPAPLFQQRFAVECRLPDETAGHRLRSFRRALYRSLQLEAAAAPGFTRSCIFGGSGFALRSHLPRPVAGGSISEFLVLDLYLRP